MARGMDGPPVEAREGLEIRLREFLDDDDAVSAVGTMLDAGWVAAEERVTDPAARTLSDSAGAPDVDTLVEKVRLGLDASLDSWEENEAALSDLAATARKREEQRNHVGKIAADEVIQAHKNLMRAEAAEADRDRLARRVAELEAALEDALTVFVDTQWHAAYSHLLAGDGGGA